MTTTMKKITAIVLFIALWFGASAQQDPQYSMYMFNGLAINPAYAGSLGNLAASALYRTQWVGIDGAPTTLVANVHQPFMDQKIGAGLAFTSDRVGEINRNIVGLSGAYHLKFPTYRLSFGIQANYNQYQVNLRNVATNPNGPADITFANNLTTSTVNFGAGAFAYAEKWFAGVSVPQLMRNDITTFDGNLQKQSYEIPHFFVHGGYIYAVNPLIDLKPSALIKMVNGAPLNFDLNLNAYYQKLYGIGLGFRNSKSLVAMAEAQVHPYLKIAYAYDRSVSNMGTFAGSTHEIMLRFMMTQKGIQISPRLY